MSVMIRSSIALLDSSGFDREAIARAQGHPSHPLTGWLATQEQQCWVERALDLAGTLVGLMLFSPVMLAIALLIRLDSPGPALFRQVRRGHRGRPSRMFKYRTMVVDAEQPLADLELCNESAGGVLLKLRDGPRVTPLGRFLRRSSLDELPRLINVLRGEMSMVGPCPPQLRDSERLREADPRGYIDLPQVLPGLTGPWQVGMWSELDYDQMVRFDLDYVADRSLGRDLWILGKAVLVVLLRRSAC